MAAPLRFRLRLLLPLILVAMALVGCLAFLQFHRARGVARVMRNTAAVLEVQTFALRNALSDLLARGEDELAARRFSDASLDPRIRVMIVADAEGRVRFATQRQWVGGTCEAVEGFAPAEANRFLREHQAHLQSEGGTRLVGYFPLELGMAPGSLRNLRQGLLFVSYDLASGLAQERRQLLVEASWILGLWLLAALILFALLDGLVTRKVDRILQTMGRIERGELAARSRLSGGDEVSRLGRAFDRLLDQIAEDQATLRKAFAALEQCPVAVIVTDTRGVIEYVNTACMEHSGYAPAELLGQNPRIFKSGETPSEAYRELWETVTAGRTWQGRFHNRRKDGSLHWAQARISPLRDDRGTITHFVGVEEDITEALAREEERRRLEQQMAQAQKLESLGSLAGGVAHDMNNVLAAILSLASVHQLEAPEGSALRRGLDTIEQACLRGRTLVQGLLGFARKRLAEERACDLNALVRDQVALLERTTLQKVRLEMDLAADLRPVRGDPSSLSHALMNLCVNAVDAMPLGGTLTLRTRNEGAGSLRLEVSDTGTGMPEEVLAKALDPFFTTKPQGKGTGLGLPIVYGTVKAHQGSLELESRPGEGTTVRIMLPACRTGAEAPDETPAPPAQGRSLDILVVDDDELLQQSTGQLLELLGHRPALAASGEEAIRMLEGGADADAVLLDLNMPGMGGAAALPRIRELRPRLPVLLTTGRPDEAALELVRRIPSVFLLAKPYALKDLKVRLGELT